MTIKELKNLKQWICWKYNPVKDGEKPKKIPINPLTGKMAKTNDENTWGTFEQANNSHIKHDGVGIVFTNGICGIDIDNKDINDPLVQDILNLFDNTYAELSPSGNGVHILFTVDIKELPTIIDKTGEIKLDPKYYQKNDKLGVECYCSGLTSRFFTFTESILKDKLINNCTQELLIFLDKYMLRSGNSKPVQENNNIDYQKIRQAGQLEKLFFNGDITDYENDRSRADLALCVILVSYIGNNPENIDKLFSKSALYREKWERIDYKYNTIQKAINSYNWYLEQIEEPNKKPGFLLFQSEELIFKTLRAEEVKELILAIFSYEGTGEEPILDGATEISFKIIKQKLDLNRQSWGDTKKDKSRAGKMSTLKKHHYETYNKFVKILKELGIKD